MNRIWFHIWCTIFRVLFFLVHPVFRVRGRERIPDGPCLLCSNHSGMADPIWLVFAIRPNPMFRSMAKIELMHVPVVGWFLRTMGAFGVNRGGHDRAAIRQSEEILLSGQKLLLYPEGTRVRPGQQVRAKTGAIRLAAATEVPILPIYTSPRAHLFSKVTVVIGEPVTLQVPDGGWTNAEYHRAADALMETIYRMGGELWV